MQWDVVVVGAGPAGSATAIHLARAGLRVALLDRARFPRDKSCGDGLTRYTMRLLARLGVLEDLPPSPPMCGARVVMRGRGTRDFRYPDHLCEPTSGTVIPREALDDSLRRRAERDGAHVFEETRARRLLWNGDMVVGVAAENDEGAIEFRAPIVVAADGAASALAYEVGLPTTPRSELGFAIRGYYRGGNELDDLLEIHMPLMDVSDQFLLPSYGWVFRVDNDGLANIGVGIVRRERDTNVSELLSRFIDVLRSSGKHPGLELVSELRGAPLRFDFDPTRCSAPGFLVVGDAAGMISPFTGEGIGYALESADVAARTIQRSHDSGRVPGRDLKEYGEELGQRFTGYFETGRVSSRRFRLVWHAMESTFDRDEPLFDICRQAAVFPEGVGESYVDEVLEDATPYVFPDHATEEHDSLHSVRASMRSDLFEVGERLLSIVRSDWPFLAKLVTAEAMTPGLPFRPALLTFLCGRLGDADRDRLVAAAVSLELGYLASIAESSVVDDDAPTDSPARTSNWANLLALTVTDFLHATSYEAATRLEAEVVHEMSLHLGRSREGLMRHVRSAMTPDRSIEEYEHDLALRVGPMFELPCRLGARHGGRSESVIRAVGTYGRHLGIAHRLIDEARVVEGRPAPSARAFVANDNKSEFGLPWIYALRSARANELLSAARRQAPRSEIDGLIADLGGVDPTLARARLSLDKARATLRTINDGWVKRALLGLADMVESRIDEPRAE